MAVVAVCHKTVGRPWSVLKLEAAGFPRHYMSTTVCSITSQKTTNLNRDLTVSIPLCPDQIYRGSQEECARLREGVPYVKVYRYNPKHLCPKLNGYGDNGQRKVWSSCGSTHFTCQLTILSISVLECVVI